MTYLTDAFLLHIVGRFSQRSDIWDGAFGNDPCRVDLWQL